MRALSLPSNFSGRLLVIRRDNIGDLVCTTPLIARLREVLPNASIEALVNSYNAQVLLRNPALNAVHVYTKFKHCSATLLIWTTLVKRIKLLINLRKRRFDIAILARPAFDQHSLNLVRWLGISHVVGFVPAHGKTPRSLRWPVPHTDKSVMHEVEAVARLASFLGIADATGPLRVFPDVALTRHYQQKLSSRWIVAVHISARVMKRRYPEDRWIALIRAILQRNAECSVALFWSPGDKSNPMHPGDDQEALRMLTALSGLPVIACPTKDLNDLMAGLAACHVFIGPDGGALHIAAALGLPCVGLFEQCPIKKANWAPWRVPSVIISGPEFAVAGIMPESILAGLTALLTKLGK